MGNWYTETLEASIGDELKEVLALLIGEIKKSKFAIEKIEPHSLIKPCVPPGEGSFRLSHEKGPVFEVHFCAPDISQHEGHSPCRCKIVVLKEDEGGPYEYLLKPHYYGLYPLNELLQVVISEQFTGRFIYPQFKVLRGLRSTIGKGKEKRRGSAKGGKGRKSQASSA